MNYRWNKKYLYWGLTLFIVICLSIIFYYLLFHGYNVSEFLKKVTAICSPIIDGLVIAFLVIPLVNYVENRLFLNYYNKRSKAITIFKKKMFRVFSMIIAYFTILILLTAFFYAIIPQIIDSIQSIATPTPGVEVGSNSFETWFNSSFPIDPKVKAFFQNTYNQYSVEFTKFVNDNLLPQLQDVVKTVSLSLIGFMKALWNILIGTIISLYVVYNKEKFAGQMKKVCYGLIGIKYGNQFIGNVRLINDKFSGFLIGKLLDSLIMGILCFIGATIFKFPYPVLISLIVGVTNIVPFFGPIIGAIPCALLVFMINPIQTIYFLIFILALQQFDGNILGPKILGVSTGLSSFWVIFAITIFGGIWGVPGMIVGVPIMAVIFAGIRTFLSSRLSQKGLSTSTDDYSNLNYIDENNSNEFVDLPKNFTLVPENNDSKKKFSLFKKKKDNESNE